jgi:hypothetical protein
MASCKVEDRYALISLWHRLLLPGQSQRRANTGMSSNVLFHVDGSAHTPKPTSTSQATNPSGNCSPISQPSPPWRPPSTPLAPRPLPPSTRPPPNRDGQHTQVGAGEAAADADMVRLARRRRGCRSIRPRRT